MTISQALSRVDALCPNTRPIAEKLAWLSQVDGQILELMSGYDSPTHPAVGAPSEREPAHLIPYGEDDLGVELLIPFPHDEVYVHYLHAMIMYAMGEFSKYENAMVQYNNAMQQFRVGFARTHMPIQPRKRMF